MHTPPTGYHAGQLHLCREYAAVHTAEEQHTTACKARSAASTGDSEDQMMHSTQKARQAQIIKAASKEQLNIMWGNWISKTGLYRNHMGDAI